MSLLYEIFILPIEIIYRAIYLGSLQFTHNYGLSILVLYNYLQPHYDHLTPFFFAHLHPFHIFL